MKRREFIQWMGAAAVARPIAAGAQQPDVSRIGFLRNTSPDARLVAALRSGLRENGYVDGRNLAIAFIKCAFEMPKLCAISAIVVSLPSLSPT